MLSKRKYNVLSTAILYFFFIVNLVLLVIVSVNTDAKIIGSLLGFTSIMIYIFLPVSIVLSIIYLIKFKHKNFDNIIVLILSFIPVTSTILMLYVVADKLSQIP